MTKPQSSDAQRQSATHDAAVDPWNYNPSSWAQRIPICLIATVAFLIATYMGLYQWRLIDSAWDPVFGSQTEKVLDSEVSESMRKWMLIPDAVLGAIAYLGDAVFGLAGSTRRWRNRPWLVIIFGIDVIPLGIVSAILVVLQGTVVGQWCFLCLVTAVLSLVLVFMAYDEVFTSLIYLWRVKKEAGSTELWNALWGKPSEVSHRVAQGMLTERADKKRKVAAGHGNGS